MMAVFSYCNLTISASKIIIFGLYDDIRSISLVAWRSVAEQEAPGAMLFEAGCADEVAGEAVVLMRRDGAQSCSAHRDELRGERSRGRAARQRPGSAGRARTTGTAVGRLCAAPRKALDQGAAQDESAFGAGTTADQQAADRSRAHPTADRTLAACTSCRMCRRRRGLARSRRAAGC